MSTCLNMTSTGSNVWNNNTIWGFFDKDEVGIAAILNTLQTDVTNFPPYMTTDSSILIPNTHITKNQ